MAVSLTPPNLVPITTLVSGDLLVAWPSAAAGPLSKITYGNFSATLAATLNASFLQISQNLADLGNPTTARTNLGLGTAATANIGTSGNAVPLLNTSNTFSASQNFAYSASATAAYGASIQNTAAYAVGNTAAIRYQAASGGDYAVAGSYADGAANAAGFYVNVSLAGNGINALKISSAGLFQLPLYTTPGLLRNDATGNLTSLPYSTGTFTPTVSAGTYAIAYATQSGVYTRIGDLVYIEVNLSFTPSGAPGAGSFLISGLPFNLATAFSAGVLLSLNGAWVGYSGHLSVAQNTVSTLRILFVSTAASGTSVLSTASMTTGVQHTVNFAMWYKT